MRAILLGTALVAGLVSASPGAAQLAGTGPQMNAPQTGTAGQLRRGDRDDRPRDRRRGDVIVLGGYGYGGEWALYNNRTFEPDSYNDWWHERTERSYPRWMQNNQNCERRWWGGGAWRC